jgi:hypothetical protein
VKTKEQILVELYDTQFVDNYARKIAGVVDRMYLEDIVGDLYLMICELPADLIVTVYNRCGINCFRQYISGMIYRQMKSTNSKVYRNYKKHAYDTIPASQVENIDKVWGEGANS